MNVKVMTITPQLAEKWIQTSNGNPRWRDGKKLVDMRRANVIAEDIKSGKWIMGNGSIAFDQNGSLVDGHHRLTAIQKAGIPVQSIVVFGVTDEGILHIDENRTRSVPQRLGVDNGLVAVAGIHLILLGTVSSNVRPSAEQVSDFLEQHPMIYSSFSAAKHGATNAIARRAALVHAGMCAMEFGVQHDTVERFFEVVNTGFSNGLGESSAVVIRNTIMKGVKNSIHQSIALDKAAQSAICDFANGTPRRTAYKPKQGYYFDTLVRMGVPGYEMK